MNTIKSIAEAGIAATGIQSAYRIFTHEPAGKYITWYIDRESISGSDDGALRTKTGTVIIELFSPAKDWDAEAAIEDAFAPYDIDKSEFYDDSENLFIITYTINIVAKIK